MIPYGFTDQNFPDTAITGTEFAGKIAAIPAAKKIILLDCCHAGGVGDVKSFGLTKSSLPAEALDLFKQSSGYVIIASSTETEKSYTGNPYSAFTGVLIEALCGEGVAKKDGYVRVADLAGYTRERVPRITDDKQHPVLHFEQADKFAIAYYAAGDNKAKALPFTLQAKNDNSVKDTLSQKLKHIEDLFVRARYDQAYTQFRDLCNDYPDYQIQASMILTRYQDFENQVISGIIPAQNTVKLEIAAAFQTCLRQFKREYL